MNRSLSPTHSRRGFRDTLSTEDRTIRHRGRPRPSGAPKHRGLRGVVSGAVALTASAALVLTGFLAPASAAPQSVHEITANWAGDPLPTEAPFGQPVTAEFHVNTNDNGDPYTNEPVENVRATLTVGNGAFTSIPQVCKTTDVTPISEISADGTTLLCNLGTITEGTASVIQAPVRATSSTGGDLTVVGTATSDSAVAEAGPVDPGPLPIIYVRGMDLSLVQAPGQNAQGGVKDSRLGGSRPTLLMNYSLILDAGSRPGPASYSFPVNISANVAGATNGLEWEDCVPISNTSRSTGQPFSDPAQPDRTNFPTCGISGTGTNYTVSLTDLDYTLVNAPVNDSFGQPLPGNGVYIASGTVEFSIPSAVTQITTYTFTAAPGVFTFDDGVSEPDSNSGNNVSSATLTPPGGFSNHWTGAPASSRTVWDANLWVSPGTSQNVVMPQPGLTEDNWDEEAAAGRVGPIALYHQANTLLWNGYSGPGGGQMAGVCTMNQNPAFVPTSFEGGGWNGGGLAGYENYETARFFYTTAAIDTKTETCGDPAPSAKWVEAFPAPGTSLTDPRISTDILMQLPAGVTAVKMTWDPTVDTSAHTFLRAFGHIDPAAPTSGEGWTIGAFNAPFDVAARWPGYPTLNNWGNISTIAGGTDIPDSTYGPNANGIRDAYRLQGAQGLIEKVVSGTTAEPGVPLTYTLRAQAQNLITSPPPATFDVVDTLPEGMVYVAGSGEPAPTNVSADGRTITWTFTDVAPNVFQTIRYEAQRPADSVIAPGTKLTNSAVINTVGDNRPANTPGRTANATVTVPSASATVFGKSSEANVLAFEGDTSAWVLTLNSQDPIANAFTDTIDILPAVGDGRGTDIDGTYTITGVDAPAGSTVYYTDSAFASLSSDPRDASNGGTPGSVEGNTVNWSTTPLTNPTAIRVIAPELAPGATQTIRIAFATPAGSSCEAPAEGDNKPGQILVNSAGSYAGHTALPMLSSAVTEIGSCYAANLKKYVQDADGEWHDANTIADYPTFKVGDTIRYRIVVENIGQGTLTNVVISDDLQPELGSFTIESLPRGESETHEFEIVADATMGENVVNTACGAADLPQDPELPATINCDPAGFIVDGEPTHVKSILSATPVGNGQWEVVYGIDVTNTSTHPTGYNLDDTLHFADQAEITSATVTASPADVVLADPVWDGQANVVIASNVPLLGNDDEGYAPHHYEVTVIATVPLQLEGAGSGADDPTQCVTDDSNRAFNNTSQLTHRTGETEDDQACAPIPSIDIDKSLSGAVTAVDGQDGVYDATYALTVTNSGTGAGVYNLDDELAPGDGVTVVGIQGVTSDAANPVAINAGYDGITDLRIVTDQPIVGAADGVPVVHTYMVIVRYAVDLTGIEVPIGDACLAENGEPLPGTLNNTATVGSNDLEGDDAACIVPGKPTLDKAIVSATAIGGGQWEVVYDLTVGNTGNEVTSYDLDDELLFAPQVTVDAASVTGPEGVAINDEFDGDGDQRIATDVDIAGLDDDGYAPHVYRVTVIANVPLTFDPADVGGDGMGSPACTVPPGDNFIEQGLNNSATLTDENGGTVVDTDCAGLPSIDIVKAMDSAPVKGANGRWTVNYTITVQNDGAALGEYTLTDQLRYGTGIKVISATVTAPEGITPAGTWTGLGEQAGADENVVTPDVSLAAGGVHVYRVVVEAQLDTSAADATAITCPAVGTGDRGGFSNIAGVEHNDLVDNSTACDVPEWPKSVPPPLANTGNTVALGVAGTAVLLLIAGGILVSRRRTAAE